MVRTPRRSTRGANRRSRAAKPIGEAGKAVSKGIRRSVRGMDEIEGERTPRRSTRGANRRTRAARPIGEAGKAVSKGIRRSVRGMDEIEGEIVSTVRNAVSTTLGAPGRVALQTAAVARDVVRGAVEATGETGGAIILPIKGVAKGIVLGVADAGGNAAAAGTDVARVIRDEGTRLGSDAAVILRRAIDGIAEAIAELGGDAVRIIGAAAGATARTIAQLIAEITGKRAQRRGTAQVGRAGRRPARKLRAKRTPSPRGRAAVAIPARPGQRAFQQTGARGRGARGTGARGTRARAKATGKRSSTPPQPQEA